ncbi:MAG: CBS domain-containing protein [Pseudomonadales bacterium]
MLQVNELMSRDVSACTPDSALDEVAQMMWEKDCGAIPVVDNDNKPVGVITDRDIAMGSVLQHEASWNIKAQDISKDKEVYSCRDEDDVHDALQLMQDKQIRRLPVVDNDGHLTGMLSLNDVIIRATKTKKSNLSYEDAITTLKSVSAQRH